jgi:hypothetical protein
MSARQWTRIAILGLTLAACGGRNESTLDLDALAKRPGAEVVRRTVGGHEVVEIRQGGVTVTREHGVTTAAVDRSGHGAVLCAWRVYVDTLAAIDVCQPGEHAELRADIAQAVDAIADFIVANNLTPVTKSDLEAYIAQRHAETEAQRGAAGKVCSAEFIEQSLPKMEAIPHEQRLAQTIDLLSVPRPPVLDPCF